MNNVEVVNQIDYRLLAYVEHTRTTSIVVDILIINLQLYPDRFVLKVARNVSKSGSL